MNNLGSCRIGVLHGGDSPERSGSLISGRAAADALTSHGYSVELVDTSVVTVAELVGRIDVALIALHGPGGEDGKMQGALDTIGIPYAGSGVLASATAMYKPRFKKLVEMARLDTAAYTAVCDCATLREADRIVERLGLPVVLKPTSGGGSLETTVIRTCEDLCHWLEDRPVELYGEFMAEEFLPGASITVGLLEVGGELRTLPPLETETDRDFYDYVAKHDPAQRRYHCPARLPANELLRAQQLAMRVHRLVGAHGVSRVDFIATPNGRLSVLEINTLPGLSPQGNLATMAAADGIEYGKLIDLVTATAFTKPAYLP
ncbi:D-alanine--D-alanine ligase [Actinomadura alba]|uniref:D-alanine--D-alanine ligase n=2 Tax=Actinomadura alba TaxID=406431 RepID=A0ABR7LSL5_9ACTN|nr:D-alanine--D-alanine ligase [Actinomadura alba]